MAAEFSLVSVVLFIASGALLFMLLFLFAKRQIMRFTLKSEHTPHLNIGSDAPKALRDKIHGCLLMTQGICYEPTLLSEQVQNMANSSENHYYYRMKALDAFSNAVTTLHWSDSSIPRREAKQTIQLYLYCLCPSVIGGKDASTIEKFARSYTLARHSPVIFGENEFIKYMELLDKVIRLIKMDQKRRSSNIKAVDLEVYLKRGFTGTKTITNAKACESIPLEEIVRHRKAMPELVEQHQQMRDVSSGYSSTDRSSSQGSAERLLMNEEKKV